MVALLKCSSRAPFGSRMVAALLLLLLFASAGSLRVARQVTIAESTMQEPFQAPSQRVVNLEAMVQATNGEVVQVREELVAQQVDATELKT